MRSSSRASVKIATSAAQVLPAAVRRLALGEIALTVALVIFRRTRVKDSRTVTLPSDELATLSISRSDKRKALASCSKRG